MHTSSYRHMAQLVDRYANKRRPLLILDIGSYDVNGSYRDLFNNPGWRYLGVDVTHGPNVDVVLRSPYRLPFPDFSADVVLSGQAFEHMQFFWLMWLEMVRVLKPGGLVFLIAPSRGPEHRYPVDCWRFYPDGFEALARYGGMELAEVHTDWDLTPDPDSAAWGDTVGAFCKQPMGMFVKLRSRVICRIRRLLDCSVPTAPTPLGPPHKAILTETIRRQPLNIRGHQRASRRRLNGSAASLSAVWSSSIIPP